MNSIVKKVELSAIVGLLVCASFGIVLAGEGVQANSFSSYSLYESDTYVDHAYWSSFHSMSSPWTPGSSLVPIIEGTTNEVYLELASTVIMTTVAGNYTVKLNGEPYEKTMQRNGTVIGEPVTGTYELCNSNGDVQYIVHLVIVKNTKTVTDVLSEPTIQLDGMEFVGWADPLDYSKVYPAGTSISELDTKSQRLQAVWAEPLMKVSVENGTSSAKVTVSATVDSSMQAGTMIGIIAQYKGGMFINTFVDAVYSDSVAKATFQVSSLGLESVLVEVVDGSTIGDTTQTIGSDYEVVKTLNKA